MNENQTRKTPTADELAMENLDRDATEVIDHLLNTLSDKVIDTQGAVRENTAQLRIMASSVELVREIPEKMEELERQVTSSMQRAAALGKQMVSLDESVQKRIDALDAVVQQVIARPAMLERSIEDLQVGLRHHAALFEKPLTKSVHYRHHLDWPIAVIVVLGMICAWITAIWYNARQEADLYERSDVLWRGAKEVKDSVTFHELKSIELQYNSNPEQVRAKVDSEEASDAALTERLREINQKTEEIRQLKEQGTKR